MKRTNKVVIALGIVLCIIMVSANVFAITPDSFTGGTVSSTSGLVTVGSQIVSVIQTVGVLIAVVILLVLGIKYMLGSAEEKADYKKSMIPYLVGAVLIFAASAITGIVYDMATAIGG